MVEYVKFTKEEPKNNNKNNNKLLLIMKVHSYIILIIVLIFIWVDFQHKNFIMGLLLITTTFFLHLIIILHKNLKIKTDYVGGIINIIEERGKKRK